MSEATITENGLMVLDLKPREKEAVQDFKSNLAQALWANLESNKIDWEKSKADAPEVEKSWDGKTTRLKRSGRLEFTNGASLYVILTEVQEISED